MTRTTLLAGAAAIALALAPAPAKDKKMADEFAGVLISMSAPGAMGERVAIFVEAYSSDPVAEKSLKALAERGQKGLLEAIDDERVGTIRVGTRSGYPIAVARQKVAEDGSRTIVLVTNRPLSGFAPSQGMRIDDYPFGFVELQLDAEGNGEGSIVGAAQIALDSATKQLSVHSYATQPGRLSDVRSVKPKP